MTQSAALFGVTRSALGRTWVLAPQDEALADVLMRNLSLEAILHAWNYNKALSEGMTAGGETHPSHPD